MTDRTRTRARRGLVVVGIAAAAALAPGASLAARPQSEELQNIVIVLDSSGSMAGKLGGETKMRAAQRVVQDLVDNMPSDMNVGLVVYGATSPRERRDCQDIQLLRPVAPVQPGAVTEALASIHARGMTPIGASLLRAAEALQGAKGGSTIVLVSDGTETCDSDPCAVAEQIRTQRGIDVRVHVVGFDVEEGDRTRLECVAQGGGGTYYPAATADELEKALIEATKPPPRRRGGAGPAWMSVAHPGLGEMQNARRGWAGLPKRKFWLGFIPIFGWPGYLQIQSAIDASRGQTNDWLEPADTPAPQ
jgi:hypothetical protein